ncbi:MAG: glycoside hydrolase family 3 N-terminal domain-containing protein [Chitinophagales bacterium]|nr:serine hydrolase [Bacteroidota bacterium]MCB9043748.1 serine hydrolase [Chitinophagales bacterium]
MLILLSVQSVALFAQQVQNSAYFEREALWVQHTLQNMSIEEKIAQMIMVAAYSNKDVNHTTAIADLVKNQKIGGLIFFQGDPLTQLKLTNYYQDLSAVPLLIAQDAEWGLSMRLQDVPIFPRQLMLGAIQDDGLIYDFGKEIARECRRLGVHMNFAPVVDVNNNPNNPVINDRSFGEDIYNVSAKGIAYMQGMEYNGILACAKHFPGHGDTDADSHHSLPLIAHSRSHLDSIELYPFRQLVKRQVAAVMNAHLSIPALDNQALSQRADSPIIPASLSHKIVTELLQDELGYDGLKITDALNMKGVSNYFAPGEVDLKACLAGNDILLFSEDVPRAIRLISEAVKNNEISEAEIDRRVNKILKAKYKMGLAETKFVAAENLLADLNTPEAEILHRKLIAEAITVAKNNNQLLPFRNLQFNTFAAITIGASGVNTFQNTLSKYTKVAHYNLPANPTNVQINEMLANLKKYSVVIVSLHDMSRFADKNYGISDAVIDFLQKVQNQNQNQTVTVVFGSPYSLKYFDMQKVVVCAYQDTPLTQDITAQILFGALPAKGRLPITASPAFPYGAGEVLSGNMRLRYTIPQDVGFNTDILYQLEKIVEEGIKDKAMPGCQILIAKNGAVVYEKAFGYYTYNRKQPVNVNDLYDLASITKIAATLPALMQLYDEHTISLDETLGELLPEMQASNKANVKVREILTHEAGLVDWIPFYEEVKPVKGKVNPIFSTHADAQHTIHVADKLYMESAYQHEMWQKIIDSPLQEKKYKYSDVGFYIFQKLIEQTRHQSLDNYCQLMFYDVLGMDRTSFNPLNCFPKDEIAPTEKDTYFRIQQLQGYVHDMGAAMMGGVGGHAGLFSNANDLAKLMQMYLNKGDYGGNRFVNTETISLFTQRQSEECRRGLGFDKPEPSVGSAGPTAVCAPISTFGHTGFTGTCAWVDPDNELIYIFLSNRVYPDMKNNLLARNNIRTRIQEVIYAALGITEAQEPLQNPININR